MPNCQRKIKKNLHNFLKLQTTLQLLDENYITTITKDLINLEKNKIMKKILFFLLFIGTICSAQYKRPILMKFDTTLGYYGNVNSISIKSILIPNNIIFDYQYTYQKEGSSVISSIYNSNDDGIIDLPSSGIYTITVIPKTDDFYMTLDHLYADLYPPKLIELMQWGDYDWVSFYNTFMNCYNLKITATDMPKTMQTADFSGMFGLCESITNIPNIENWDFSNTEDMSSMFVDAKLFNQNIGNWDVSNVTDMAQIFGGATSFNQDIGSWDMSNVVNLHSMFKGATSFNQDIGNWNVSNAIQTTYMFSGATSFNQNIGNWNVSNVNATVGMFEDATSFNQNIGNWDVSKVTRMDAMFRGAKSFNQNISNWDVSKVIRMNYMFTGAISFNQDIGKWDVSKVTIMNYMFSDATSFNQDIGNWNVSKVTTMKNMLSDATSFNQNLGKWKLNNAVDLSFMLNDAGLSCQNYALTLKGWAGNPLNPSNRNLGAKNVKYGPVGKTYRDLLTTQKGWTFSGDIFEPSCNDALATNENSLSEKLNFYPNPTTGRIFYQSQTDELVQITNTAGQLLKTVKVIKGTNQIDISEFPKGVYFLRAGDKTSKLLKN